MLSLQLIRQNPDLVRDSLVKRGEAATLDEIIGLDEERRRLIQEVESLRARRKQASKEIGQMKDKPEELRSEMRDIGEQIKSLDYEISHNEEELNDLLLRLPNLVHPTVPCPTGISGRTWAS